VKQAIVDRAIKALAKIGAAQSSPERQAEKPTLSQRTQLSHSRENAAVCRSPDCGGCYLVDPETGARIHPPKFRGDYRTRLEQWEEKGKVQ
jgi:hypothetical protein